MMELFLIGLSVVGKMAGNINIYAISSLALQINDLLNKFLKIMKENWLEELHNKTIQNYNNYLDVVWDMYYAKTFGILPVKNI